jgi:Inner membrane protein YgaP-like, transmembrane domain
MKKNMGGLDRIIRLVIAAVIGYLYYNGTIEGTLGYVLLAVAAIFILTSLISSCPLYSLVGLNTCKVKN